MPRLITEWSTEDPRLAEMLTTVASFPAGSLERLELEAALHTWQAAYCNKEIGRLLQFRGSRIGLGRGGRKKPALPSSASVAPQTEETP